MIMRWEGNNIFNFINTESVQNDGTVECNGCGDKVPATFIEVRAHYQGGKAQDKCKKSLLLPSKLNNER